MAEKVESITPYSDADSDKTSQVRQMFDAIAPAYDFMNRAMTFGVDKRWRAKAVRMLADAAPRRVLDVATGTGDLAIAIARKIPGAVVTGVDLSRQMLDVGRKKIDAAGLTERIDLLQADGTNLPFASDSFDAVSIAYGIRNFADILGGYREMLRVLRPGGKLIVVELATPVNPLALAFYNVYAKALIPTVGRLVSKDRRAYSYLPESIKAVAQRADMLALMEKAGFGRVSFKPLTFGTCIIYIATKQKKQE